MSAATSSEPFKPPPDELKALTPFLQRAHETRKADPALSYWCTYYAAQLGIPRSSSLSGPSKLYLMGLLDTLEEQKKTLAANEIVHGGDVVAKAHIENVALKVFGGADNEDRQGKASKATARRFMVSCNFYELLNIFGPLEHDQEEKLKYAKWKAADIARAFREGRKPTPGPAGGLENEAGEEEAAGEGVQSRQSDDVLGIEAATARMGGLGNVPSALPSKEELDAEMARLTAQEEHESNEPVAISPNIEPPTPDRNGMARESSDGASSRSRRAESRLSYDGRASGWDGLDRSVGSSPNVGGNFNFSMPLHINRQDSIASSSDEGLQRQPGETQSAFVQYTQGRIPSGGSASGTTSPHPQRPLPHPPRGGLPLPPDGQGSTLPLNPPFHLSPSLTPPPGASPGTFPSSLPSMPPGPANASTLPKPSAPPEAVPAGSGSVATPPAFVPASDLSPAYPSSLDLKQSARVQKLAKWAVSALDYEDVDTARKHLREALDICEGRSQGQTTK